MSTALANADALKTCSNGLLQHPPRTDRLTSRSRRKQDLVRHLSSRSAICETAEMIGLRKLKPRTSLLQAFPACVALVFASAGPAIARDSLGMFGTWGAFRDPAVPRCYAIAQAEPSTLERDYQPYLAIGTWPRRGERGQVHFRVSRHLAPGAPITLNIGGQRFALVGGGGEAWAADRRADAAIVAAMRSAPALRLSARDARGRPFGNSYDLAGAATAMDAATVACARLR